MPKWKKTGIKTKKNNYKGDNAIRRGATNDGVDTVAISIECFVARFRIFDLRNAEISHAGQWAGERGTGLVRFCFKVRRTVRGEITVLRKS